MPAQKPLAATPVFEHLSDEFGRRVLSAQTCGSYPEPGSSERWYVARTHLNQEFVALVDLKRIGFAVHLSLWVKRAMGHRRATFGKPVIRRMFPGYLFVALDLGAPGWAAARSARGVAEIMSLMTGNAAMPTPVPPWVMDRLLKNAGEAGYVDTVSGPTRKKAPSGPFVSLTEMTVDERLAWLMDVMRKRSEADEEAAFVEAAEFVA